MTPLLLALAVAAAARVESVGIATAGARTGLLVVLSGRPGLVAVQREGESARVSIGGSVLGQAFGGGDRFSWTPTGRDADLLARSPAQLRRLDVVATPSDVSLLLRLPTDTSIDLRPDARGLIVFFRESTPPSATAATLVPASARVAAATPQSAPPSAEPAAKTPPQGTAPPAEPDSNAPSPPSTRPQAPNPTPGASERAPATPAPVTPDLVRALFPGGSETTSGEKPTVAELYQQLWPGGKPEAAPEASATAGTTTTDDTGRPLGPFRVRAGLDARYVDADTFVDASARTTRDRYLEVVPRVDAETPLGAGRFSLGYNPSLRALATYDQVNSSSHLARADLELPIADTVTLHAADRFVVGTLDTRYADPGGEYFFGLGRFWRNDVDGGAKLALGPRGSLELVGTAGRVRFLESSSFFDYDTRRLSAGIGYELTPSLRAVAYWDYDTVPRPDERPEAESRAHQGRLSLRGDILPLLSGELSVGYRDQKNPNAAPGGTRYTGLTWAGSLQRRLSPEATLGLNLSRSTQVSSFERNGFYVATSLQASIALPLPFEALLDGGVGYQWNDYRTIAAGVGAPRADRLLGWYAGLRRSLHRRLYLSGLYRAEERRSNVDAFDTSTDGFYVQLQWNPIGPASR
ncbi:MAG: outer membrane beta-barrel protein [Vicinamibacteria bacterium]